MNIPKNTTIDPKSSITYDQNTKKNPIKAALLKEQSNDDTVLISNEAKKRLLEDKKAERYEEKRRDLEEALRILESAPDEEDNPMRVLTKCLQIAMRIMSGDNVPAKDRAFLAEHEPELYANAIMFREKNDDPKKYKSLLDDEKREANDPTSPVSLEDDFGGGAGEDVSIDSTVDSPKIE